MSNQKTVVFLASFGTNVIRAKESSYDKIQAELALSSGLPVWQVFTNDETARAMNGVNGAHTYTLEDALETALIHGFTQVAVVPVFFAEGSLYNDLKKRLDFYRDRIDITLARAIMYDESSAAATAEVLLKAIKPSKKLEYLFVGHGSSSNYVKTYGALEESIRRKGYENVRVLKVRDKDCVGQAVAWLKSREADLRNVQVELVPLVIAWGDYMADEVYTSNDSLMWQLRKAGFRTIFTGDGLGQYPEFRQVYTQKLSDLNLS